MIFQDPFQSELFYPGHDCDSVHHLTEPNAVEKAFQCPGPAWGQVFMTLVHKQQHLKKAKGLGC